MKLITLMTDFGLEDGYPGVMKGVIYGITPDVQIVDLSHTIPPQNVRQGGIIWSRSYAYFPSGTIHVGVVDPGVGTQRRPIAARLGPYYFVCPDNGLITRPLEEAEAAGEPVEIVHLDNPQFWLPRVSNVFHGRDIFAPAAAYLARGAALAELGSPIQDPIRDRYPRPARTAWGWHGEVTDIDHFGNMSVNVQQSDLTHLGELEFEVRGEVIRGLSRTFGDGQPGDLVALIDSSDQLSICVVNGSAAERLGASIGDQVEVRMVGSPQNEGNS